MDTYRWAEGFQSQRRRHLKRGCCFSCYFPLFLPSGEEQDYLGGRTLLGTSKWGSVGCKDGVYWIWGGLGGQNIARTKCGIGCGVGSDFFFPFFHFHFPFFKIGFAGIFLDWTERVSSRLDTLYTILNTPAFTSAICQRRSTKQKKSVGIKRTG